MPLSPNFSTSESLYNNNLVSFTDTSTGTDGTIVNRRIYVMLANGNYLTTSGESTSAAYENWSYSETSIQLDLLSRSTTANVRVEWWSNSAKVYEKEILCIWNLYDYVFLFGQQSNQTSTPSISEDNPFYPSVLAMIVNLFNAESSTTLMDDLFSSQAALDRNYNLIQNQNMFF